MAVARSGLLAALIWSVLAAPVAAGVAPETIVAALRSQFASVPVWVIGERHRTASGHRFFLDLVRDALEAGEQVLVGLEIPADRQGQLEAILASGVGEAATPVVIDCPSYRDLLRGLGDLLRAFPAELKVQAIDAPWGSIGDRDAHMAAILRQEQAGRDRVLVLVGNLHALKRAPRRLATRLVSGGLAVASVLQLGVRNPQVDRPGVLLAPDEPSAKAKLRELVELSDGLAAKAAAPWHRAADLVLLRD